MLIQSMSCTLTCRTDTTLHDNVEGQLVVLLAVEAIILLPFLHHTFLASQH